ncbi:MAG: hypothetical protein QM820_03500 [Minicystis sp.]
MARSIHDTWGVMERAERADWSDPDVPRAIKAEMMKNWRRQQTIRESVRQERRRGAEPPPPIDLDRLPILVDDAAPYVFHPASEEDIRAVLRRLPPGSLDGLQAVRRRIDHTEENAAWPRDPFTFRRRFEILPGIYTSSIFGRYLVKSASIELYAFLCEPHVIAPLALFFKVCGLRTLVHEAAHHFDMTFRLRRSRWDVGDREKHEDWAYRSEDGPGGEIVCAYVLERYPSECAALEAWVVEHGGAAPGPLAFLIGECDSMLRRPLRRLARAVLSGHERDASHVTFARELHRIGGHEVASEIVRAVLARRPDDPGALAVTACLAQCDRRDFEIAEASCLRAIACDPSCVEARTVLVRGYAIREKWDRAALACEEALSVIPAGDVEQGGYVLETLVESHLLLGASAEVGADLARMRAWGAEDTALGADVYDVIARCWAEQWEEALLLTLRLSKTGKYDAWDHWLAAVRFECAHRLRRPHLAGVLGEADLARLARRSFTRAWSQRIRGSMNAS